MGDQTSSSSLPIRSSSSSPEQPQKRGPNRHSRSCRVCRLRKVKCDRVRPCQACCAHGHPSKCIYESSRDDNLGPISQAEEIRNLRAEIKALRSRVDRQAKDRTQNERCLAQLETIFDSIRSAPLDVVEDIIADIRSSRNGSSLEKDRTLNRLTVYGPSYPLALIPTRERDRSQSVSPEDDSIEVINGHGELVSGNSDRLNLSSNLDGSGKYWFESDEMLDCLSRHRSPSIYPMASQRVMLDIYLERFLDAFSPEVDDKSGRAGAIRTAAEIRIFSPLISDAFEAVSQAFFGRSIREKRIEREGYEAYSRVLMGLKKALVDPERRKAESTLVTVILLMAWESVERTTPESVATHIKGALRLIEQRGPENHMYGVEHLVYTELRGYWVGGALVDRRPSFLAHKDWKTIPWSAGTTKKDILHHLLDLAVEIPTLLYQYDQLQAAQQYYLLGPAELRARQTNLYNEAANLTARYLQWKRDWVDDYSDGPPQEVESQTGDYPFPVFRCRDLRTGRIIQPTTLIYPNLRLAESMCMYYTTRLILSSINIWPDNPITPMAEQYQLGCGICRSLEWYIRTAPGNMINRLAFSVRVGWEVFPANGPEREFIQQVVQFVGERHSLGLWRSVMPELSPHVGSGRRVKFPKTGSTSA